jgi:hypothetical protein
MDESLHLGPEIYKPWSIAKIQEPVIKFTLYQWQKEDPCWKFKEPYFTYMLEQCGGQYLKDWPVFVKQAKHYADEFFNSYQLGMN